MDDDTQSTEQSQSQLSQVSAVSDTQLLESSLSYHDEPKSRRKTATVIPDSAVYVGGTFIALLVVGGILACAMALRTTTSRLDLIGTGLPLAGAKEEDDSISGHVVGPGSGPAGDGGAPHDHDKPSNLGPESEDASEDKPTARTPKRRRTPSRRSYKKATTEPPTSEAALNVDESSEAAESTVALHDEEATAGFEATPTTRSRRVSRKATTKKTIKRGRKGRVATSKPAPRPRKGRGRGRSREESDSSEEENEREREPTERETAMEAESTEESTEESTAEFADVSADESTEEAHEVTTRRLPVRKSRAGAKKPSRAPVPSTTAATEAPPNETKKGADFGRRPPELPHYLLCTVSSLAVEEVRYPHDYCTHIIYTHADFDFNKKAFIAPMASLSFSSFLRSKSKWANETAGPRYLVSLSPAFVTRNAYQMASHNAVRSMIEWLQGRSLSGLALVEQVLTAENAEFYVKFGALFKDDPFSGLEFVLGFSSGELQELQPTLSVLSLQVDYMILETHVKQFPESCIAVFPTAFNASRNPKVLQLKTNLFPRPVLQYVQKQTPGFGRAKTCISILMGVLMYIVPHGLIHAPSQDCIDFSWQAYSEVCHKKSTFKYYEWAEAVVQSTQSRMYMFDDETTIVNKVKKANHFSPNTCISLYRADLDDYGGTCNGGSPFLRVAAVHRAVFDQDAASPGTPSVAVERKKLAPDDSPS